MSQHPIPLGSDTQRIVELCTEHLRPPINVSGDPVTGEITLHFDPDLTSTEVTLLAELIALAGSEAPMSPTDYAAVRAQMQTLRDLRQMGRASFMALTAAERDRLTYDVLVAVTQVLLQLLRDEP